MKRVSIFLIMVALMAGMLGCDGGQFPPSKDLEIREWYDLDAVRDNLSGNHTLMNDLNSTTPGYQELASPTANGGNGWQPIGAEANPFTGTFDGQEYQIEDLFINRPTEDGVGLFGCVDNGGIVDNLGVVNAEVSGQECVGGLVGWNDGTVSNSYYTGIVTGEWQVGGLVGKLWTSTVSNSYASSNVTGNGEVGALVGSMDYGTVNNSYYNYDEVLINGESIITIGALSGEDFEQWLANDKFLDVNERLSQENGYYVINNVGDFRELLAFGQDASLKFRLKNDLDLSSEPSFYVPYLAGEFDGNSHKISGLSFIFDFVAHVGLFGYVALGGTIGELGVESTTITGGDSGALVGWNNGTVSNSYSTGNVTDGGGLVGYNHLDIVSNSFWDTETSGQAASDGGTGKNTTEMQDIATFSGVGWNIIAVAPGSTNTTYIWNIVNNVTYPFLSWQPVS